MSKRYMGYSDRAIGYADLETRFSSYNTKAEAFVGDSVTDDRLKLHTLVNVTMQPNGGQLDVVGVPRVASNVTIPSNVTLRFVDGAYLAPDVGVTITHNGRVNSTPKKIFGGGGIVSLAGAIAQVFPHWWGATGDGVTDDTNAIKAMILATPLGPRTEWLGGSFLVTDTVCDGRTALSQCWVGQRTERGTDAFAFRGTYSRTRIVFRPANTAKPLFRVYSTTAADNFLGPFEFKNMSFDIGDANGFVMGVEDIANPTTFPANPAANIEGDGQELIFGFRMDNCAILATHANRASVAGVITRSGRRMVSMAHCFEAVFQDVSLLGCDTQIRCYGNDKPTFRNIRSQWSHLPLDMIGSGNLRVQHTIDNFQCEGWTFTPMRVKDCTVAASKMRLEQNDGAPVGSGRFALPGTVSVTADSAALVFSQSMDNILFPYLSIVELTDGTNTLQVLVATVNGANVTFDNRATVCTWTAAAATATRIHGYGPIQMSQFGSAYSEVSASASNNCPSFVYVMDSGVMAIDGAQTASGNYGDIRSMILGNIFPTLPVGELRKLQGVAIFDGCDSWIPPLPHPFARITTHRDSYGSDNNLNQRLFFGAISDAELAVRRKWVWTPSTFGHASPEPIVKIAGDANTLQKEWVWQKRSAGGVSITCVDNTVPSDATSFLRVRYKAAAVAGNVVGFAPFFSGNGGGSALTAVTLTATPKIFEFIIPLPAQWQGVRTGAPGINFGSTGYYLYGVSIEEITAQDRAHFPAGVGTMVKAGAVADADFISPPQNGTLALDSTNHILYIREGGAWNVFAQRSAISTDKGDADAVVAAGDPQIPSTTPR
jgi:hypothetical protein